MRLYFWVRMRRVFGKSPARHTWYAACGTDAETTGRFDDSVTRVSFVDRNMLESASAAAERHKTTIHVQACRLGFNDIMIVSISGREYEIFEKSLNDCEVIA
jgi:hypothetical protein